MKEIKLTQGFVVLVDNEDYDSLVKHKWHAHVDKRRPGYVMARRQIWDGARQCGRLMHRAILNVYDTQVKVDHIDGNPLNNQRRNLRLCTHSQNCMNQRPQKGSSSKYKGVTWHSRINKWMAQIKANKTRLCLGYFIDEKEAAIAYNKAAEKLHGDYANLNHI